MTTIYDILGVLSKNIDDDFVIVQDTRNTFQLPIGSPDRLIFNRYSNELTYIHDGIAIVSVSINDYTIRYVYDFNDYCTRIHSIDISEEELFQLSLIEKNVIGITEIGIIKKALNYTNIRINGGCR